MAEQGGDGPGRAALPKYVQISELLIREIAAGHLADGTRLPPEREMAGQFGLSVGTLRKALAELEGQGLLERRQGSGNYVRHRPGVSSVYAFFRLERVRGGGLPTADLVSVSRALRPGDAPAFGQAAEAHRIRRVRRIDGEAVALEEIWLDGAVTERIEAEALSESLYLFYRRALGLVIQRVEDRIGQGAVPPWAPEVPGLAPGRLVPLVERLGWADAGAPVEFSRTWFDPDKARYVSRVGKG